MKIIADTNILLRATLEDDVEQARQAQAALNEAELIIVGLAAWCEFSWVLRRLYKKPTASIAQAIKDWLAVDIVITDLPAVEAGLAILEAGGDFADGVMAYEGRRLGGQTVLTFDKEAAKLLSRTGAAVHLLPG